MKKLVLVMIMMASLVGAESTNVIYFETQPTNTLVFWKLVDQGVFTNDIRILDTSFMSNIQTCVYYTKTPISIIESVKIDGFLTNVIEELGKQGEICKIYGHQWKNGYSNDGTETRRCKICGLEQLQKWE
ncbi:MAG: hypothetical protein M0P12_03005 [Paludibacteraceae bacterium]|nr:hypothetical protein [Paludibacteraceae bacterium]